MESKACEEHADTPERVNAYAIRDLAFQNDHSVPPQTSMWIEISPASYHSHRLLKLARWRESRMALLAIRVPELDRQPRPRQLSVKADRRADPSERRADGADLPTK